MIRHSVNLPSETWQPSRSNEMSKPETSPMVALGCNWRLFFRVENEPKVFIVK